jgi:peptide/nickel transport system permease protein
MKMEVTVLKEKLGPLLRANWSARIIVLAGFSIILFLLFLSFFAERVAPFDAYVRSLNMLSPPSSQHLMGTDSLGRDVFSRVLVGTRNSLTVAFLAVSLSAIIGMILGSASGYFAGKLDRALLLVMDALYAFPSILTAVIVSVSLGPGLLNTSLAIVIPLISPYFRIVRSITLSVKHATFVEAERSLGAGSFYILRKHISPFYMAPLLVLVSLSAARAILTVATLGFLGLGVPPPTAEWGTDLSMGRPFIPQGVWWTTIFPGLFIFTAIMGFNLFSDGLTDILRVERQLYYK